MGTLKEINGLLGAFHNDTLIKVKKMISENTELNFKINKIRIYAEVGLNSKDPKAIFEKILELINDKEKKKREKVSPKKISKTSLMDYIKRE